MTPTIIVNRLLEAHYSYATTDIALPPELGDFIIQWGELNIPDDDLYTDEDGESGREQEQHITVKYGLLAKDVPEELYEIVESTAPFQIELGNVSLFTNDKFDVVKIDVKSPELMALNKRISEAIPHEDSYPTYVPHVTVAYVKKGTAGHIDGDDPFKDALKRGFMASGLTFRGAGDSDSADRVVEPLLFSQGKTKEPEAVVVENAQPTFRHVDEGAVFAAMQVQKWQREGLTTEQMERRLTSGNWSVAMKYWHNRDRYPLAYKRFVETAEHCITHLRETRFNQAVSDPDPFASCMFPVDPDRTRLFLRNSSKRRGERPIL